MRREPEGGWPLDGLFVGIATLRVTRELFRDKTQALGGTLRAWDLALWSGVTPTGAGDSLERLERIGLVRVAWLGPDLPPGRRPPPGQARTWQLNAGHPLYQTLGGLFEAEDRLARPARAAAPWNLRSRSAGPDGRSPASCRSDAGTRG